MTVAANALPRARRANVPLSDVHARSRNVEPARTIHSDYRAVASARLVCGGGSILQAINVFVANEVGGRRT